MPQDNRGQVDADLAALTVQRVPGQSSGQNQPARHGTRMMIDADFSLRRELPHETQLTVARTPVNKRNVNNQK
jgi:hypothetical protein